MLASRRCAFTKAPNASAMSGGLSMMAFLRIGNSAESMPMRCAPSMPRGGRRRRSGLGVSEHPVDGDQQGDPARVDPGRTVSHGVATLGLGDVGGVPADADRALQADP